MNKHSEIKPIFKSEFIKEGLMLSKKEAGELLGFVNDIHKKIEEAGREVDVTNTKLRKFYDEIIRVKEELKSNKISEEEALKRLVMVIPKVEYDINRMKPNERKRNAPVLITFDNIIRNLIDMYEKGEKETLDNFFTFTEIIYAFLKK